jgi:DNA-directed RNA polymerase specialized sigma24 family protein
MTNEQFEQHYLPKYQGAIRALARKLARGDADLYEDLAQTGLIALWQIDLSTCSGNEDPFIRQVLWNKIVTFLRRSHARKFKSLDRMLEAGNQVIAGGGGWPELIPVVDSQEKEAARTRREHNYTNDDWAA